MKKLSKKILLFALGATVAIILSFIIYNETKDPNCSIKGNISYSGEKIYHTPGCEYYNKTKINTNEGERWFCSESSAINAGRRKAQNCY